MDGEKDLSMPEESKLSHYITGLQIELSMGDY